MKKVLTSAVITCAGDGCRFGHNKLMAPLGGKPVFIRTIQRFAQAKEIDEILVAVRGNEIKNYHRLIKKEGLKAKLVKGGEQRHISAYNCVKQAQGRYVVTHDGARPLISPGLINKIAQEAKKNQAVILAVETHTSIKKINGFCVAECLARKETWLAQTPQAFERQIILKAYEKAIREKEIVSTDDSELVSRLGIAVKIIPGDFKNIKITMPLDLLIARSLYQEKNV